MTETITTTYEDNFTPLGDKRIGRGDRVVRVAKNHVLRGVDYGTRESYQGATGTVDHYTPVTGVDSVRVRWDHDGKFSIVERDDLRFYSGNKADDIPAIGSRVRITKGDFIYGRRVIEGVLVPRSEAIDTYQDFANHPFAVMDDDGMTWFAYSVEAIPAKEETPAETLPQVLDFHTLFSLNDYSVLSLDAEDPLNPEALFVKRAYVFFSLHGNRPWLAEVEEHFAKGGGAWLLLEPNK